MSTVSGIVPDGVAAAFLTSADGTAVRADVKDNAYAFVVPRTKRPEQRYVVWTGGDGTPHVQPLAWAVLSVRIRCADQPKGAVRVFPSNDGLCPHFARGFPPPPIAVPVPVPGKRPNIPLVVQTSACAIAPFALPAAPGPPRGIRAPIPRRHR